MLRLLLLLLLTVLFSINLTENQLILFDRNQFEFDCLSYEVSSETFVYQQLANIINDVIDYCIRPTNQGKVYFRNLNNRQNQWKLTFEELKMSNISSEHLLSWSIPIELIEEYEFYLNEQTNSLSEVELLNCSKPWFGHECQYSFLIDEQMSFDEIVEHEFSSRLSWKDSSNDELVDLTCYVHLKCWKGSELNCLDWREICNGYVDCLNDGLDEKDCFLMEMNECSSNEYRCHNGLCIPEQFWENGFGEADCLDRSDEVSNVIYPSNCYRDPRFRCEEHSCRTNWFDYPCGDGQCVQKFDQCHNGRHRHLIDSISQQNQLNHHCFIFMICLTKLVHSLDCQSILNGNSIEYCEDLFMFPSIPIDFNHIYLLYENISMKTDEHPLIYPDYICFNQTFCEHLKADLIYKNLSCLNRNQSEIISEISGNDWIDIMLSIDIYFRSCFTNVQFLTNLKDYENVSSLYRCENSSKLISKSRILDENSDCYLNDDEDGELSCLINNKNHVQCLNDRKCYSLLHTTDECQINRNYFPTKIPFRSLCNGLEEYLYKDSITNELLTDESNCTNWPCRNLYSECDSVWSCSNGVDEFECSEKVICPLNSHPCLSIVNHSLICLPSNLMNNQQIDCLGGTDEIGFCKRVYPSSDKLFHCQDSDTCLSLNDICNGIPSCPNRDDELFCENQTKLICSKSITQQTTIEKTFCYLFDNFDKQIDSFSLKTTNSYPKKTFKSSNINQTIQSKEILEKNHSTTTNNSWPWFCNRGLGVVLRRNDVIEKNKVCLCPPSYYGDRCQFQNERVSLSLQLIRAKINEIYTVVILLINSNLNEEEKLNSLVEYVYISSETCSIKINRYLLFDDRPKNRSHRFYVRIDVYEKRLLSYRGSWFVANPFSFLPVNRLGSIVYINENSPSISSQCLHRCFHGQCFQYQNRNESFCRCFPGWKGIHCDLQVVDPTKTGKCSNGSLIYYLTNDRSECICRFGRFGRRCSLSLECPKDYCLNEGECIRRDLQNSLGNKYKCICPNEYYGSRCQFKKYEFHIEIEDLHISSYILAYFFRLRTGRDPEMTILIEKLTLFQFQVRFLVRVHHEIVLVKLNDRYYLSFVDHRVNDYVSTKINPSRECFPVNSLMNFTGQSQFERMKSYHLICLKDIECFYDEHHLCICTKDSFANCFEFNQKENLECKLQRECLNGGQCFQDDPVCPSRKICVCRDCFFGSQCQFYGKGLGLTLDEILTYQIKLNEHLFHQPLTIQLSCLLTIVFFLIGLFNSMISIVVFKQKSSQEVGSGIYLLVCSIISLLINILFLLKYVFLISSSKIFFGQKFLIYSNCFLIEPLLKLLVYINNWLNVCIGCERAFTVFKGISFNKILSRKLAKIVCLIVCLVNFVLICPQLFYLNVYYDENEKRTWCGIYYSTLLYNYNSFLEFFHNFSPFILNLFSSLFIIVGTTKQKLLIQKSKQIQNQLKMKLNQHKYLVISPILILILSFPRLILSFTLNCQKSSSYFWLYLLAYQFSFFPSIFIFCLFVLPSPTYQKQFQIIFKKTFFFSNKQSNNNNNNNNNNKSS